MRPLETAGNRWKQLSGEWMLHLKDWEEQGIARWLGGKLRLGAWCCLWEAGCTDVSVSGSVPVRSSGTEAGFCVTRLGEKGKGKERK